MNTIAPRGTRTVTRRGLLRAGAFAAASGTLAGGLLTDRREASAAGLARATLRLNFNPNAEHAPYYLGKKKGFYADQGIDLNILPGTGSAVAVRLVGAGDSMFGVAVADAVTVGRASRIPVVSLGVLLQNSPTVLASLKAKNITKPTDLYGKRVGDDPASTIHAFWRAFLKINNLDTGKITEITVSGSNVGPLIAGAIDAAGLLLTNEVVVIESRGYALNVINYADYHVKSYGQTVFTSESVLNGNRDLAKRMALATFKSWTYTLDHVDEAIAALAEAVPETNKKLETSKWPAIKRLVWSADARAHGFGYQSLAGWTQTYNTFRAGGLIQNDFDPKAIFTDIAFEK
jgi:ABC-type nitrate/sulfonate/bicarbonate transport system substrate-binding protein